jgi:hypothetical protein
MSCTQADIGSRLLLDCWGLPGPMGVAKDGLRGSTWDG